MKILLIEDEQKFALNLASGLEGEGYQTEIALNGLDGLQKAVEGTYDLVILDWMLPGIDGLAVLSALRRSRKVPVLMLTARVDVDDRVRALRAGADDYLTKPFSFSELAARIEALMRRDGGVVALHPQRLVLADLEVDLLKHRVVRAGYMVELSPKEFALLALLLENVGRAVTRTQISEKVWGINFNTETNVVEVSIRRLRIKLDHPFSKPLLHTIRGVGYILESRDVDR